MSLLATAYDYSLNRSTRLRVAVVAAVILHLLLAFLLPNIAPLQIPNIDRGTGLLVFLRTAEKESPLDQNLNNPGRRSEQPVEQASLSVSAPSTRQGDSDTLTEPSAELESNREDSSSSQASGQDQTSGVQPTLYISRSMIRLFSQQEAVAAADQNPQALERFNRSFRTRANVRRRPRSEEFRDIYGDYYVRNQASDGDICFMQQQDQQPDEYSFTTVYFFRCGKQPQNFELPSGAQQPEGR